MFQAIVLEVYIYQHKKMFWLHAVIVMPEHVHLIFDVCRDQDTAPFSLLEVMQNRKGVSAHRINRLLKRKGKVWQEESFDHVLRSEERLEDRIEYLRQNPVRRGLCRAAEEYPWVWVNPEPFM